MGNNVKLHIFVVNPEKTSPQKGKKVLYHGRNFPDVHVEKKKKYFKVIQLFKYSAYDNILILALWKPSQSK